MSVEKNGESPPDIHREIIDRDGDFDEETLKASLTTGTGQAWQPTSAEEKAASRKLNRKLDLMILPLLAMAYMFNQLDRTNLGNAETAGFTKDLHLPKDAVNTAVSLFYITYLPFIPLASALGRRFGPHRFMGATLVCWGIITIGHAFVKTDAQLIALRLLMGLAECGFYPSALHYLSTFYPRFDLAFRFALFYGFFSIAGAFGGLVAFGILRVKGTLYSWQYLFILEGCVPVILGLIAPFWLAKNCKTAWYLSASERELAGRRMQIEEVTHGEEGNRLSRRDFMEAFTDWRIWTTMLGNLLTSLASQGLSVFMPIIIKGFGYTQTTTANLMTVPPYIAGAVGVWIMAWSSDRFNERAFHLLGSQLITILGLILTIVIPHSDVGGRYAGLIILTLGAYSHAPLAVAWLANNTPASGKRAVALGISGYANLAGVIGAQIFLPKYAPYYLFPLQLTCGLVAVGWIAFAMTYVSLRVINKRRAAKVATMTSEEIEEGQLSTKRLGDKKVTFVYGL
ncbi:hypothetical protein E4T49_05018 [Aureobasidium sp. EXF-10728]|nr:hypothetical protein E4T49_05018 [Aureobasidium sp. EXF-10728]